MKWSRSVSEVFFVVLIFTIKRLEGLTAIKCNFVVMGKVYFKTIQCAWIRNLNSILKQKYL